MPTNEMRREAAKRKLDRQLARRAERAKARRRYAVVGSATAVVLVVGVVVLIVTLGGGRDQPVNAAPTPTIPATPTTKPTTVARPQPLPDSVDCQYQATQQTPARPVNAPQAGPTTTKGTVSATMQTSAGPIGLTLDRALAPCTVHSFINLAEQGFYSNTPCHRLVTGGSLQVLQCGDPTGSGSGGPGYAVADEVFPELTYPRGYVAMANAGPNTGGSQFFLIYGDSQLPPDYTVFATISPDGIAVVEQIAKVGSDGSLEPSPGGGKPKQPITITSVDIAAP
ncbi:MAG TPA: peptidylprolyl isomerase [Pseudonocardiaceae bacterium]|nr:peptidylprolyl isomerase [Pseudonocardiaceae bacterium]